MNISIQVILEGALVLLNLVLVYVGLRVRADIADVKLYVYEKFVPREEFREFKRTVQPLEECHHGP